MREQILLNFTAALGINSTETISAESDNEVVLTRNVLGEALLNFPNDSTDRFAEAFDGAYSFDVWLRPEQVLTITDNAGFGNIAALIQALDTEADASQIQFKFELKIQKNNINLNEKATFERKQYYFFAKNFTMRILDSTWKTIPLLFDNVLCTSLVVVGESNIKILGDFLVIMSEDFLDVDLVNIRLASAARKRRSQNISSWAHAARQSEDTSELAATPIQFECESKFTSKENETLIEPIIRHYLMLFLYFTTNTFRFSDGEYSVTYANISGDQQTTIVFSDVPNTATIKLDEVSSLLKWLGGEATSDRLRYFQIVVANELRQEEQLETFMSHIGTLAANAEHYYRLAKEKDIGKNYDLMVNISRSLSETNRGINTTIDDLTKSITETFLSTIGVVFLGLIAALSSGKLPAWAFAALMVLYAVVYIFVLQREFRLEVIKKSYESLKDAASTQLTEHTLKLGEQRRSQLDAELTKSTTAFDNTFESAKKWLAGMAITVFIFGTVGTLLLNSAGIFQSTSATASTLNSSMTMTPTGTTTPTGALTPISTAKPVATQNAATLGSPSLSARISPTATR